MAGERILVVEDDRQLAGNIGAYLTSEGFIVRVAHDGTEGLHVWATENPDLLLLDWMLPGLSGLEICRQVRATGATPVILVTARSDETERVLGLELGADDYLSKPFSLRELTARVRAVLRRFQLAGRWEEERVRFGELVIDLAGHTIRVGASQIELTSNEFKLLSTLARSPGRVFTRLQLMESALGEYYDGYERTIDTFISRLRKRLDAASVRDLIQTVHGVGYKLVPPT